MKPERIWLPELALMNGYRDLHILSETSFNRPFVFSSRRSATSVGFIHVLALVLNDLKCVEWDVKPCSVQSNLVLRLFVAG